jgi:anthranilate phosphoribosyltransferase
MTEFTSILADVASGRALSAEVAREAFDIMMSGGATQAQMGAFVMGLRVRGETVDEITGGARSMRAFARTLRAPDGAIDTCGTGGDASGTYNISTAVGLVAAACGVPVAKHGNRALSSKSGSADVLTALGVNIEADIALVERGIREIGIGFLMAPRHHSAMRFVGPVRQQLKTRTIFNLLGPLANPAGTQRQLMGVYAEKWVVPLAHVLRNLGATKGWVVHGGDGLDELTTTSHSFVAALEDGDVHTFEVTPEDAGLPRARPEDLKGGDAAHNAAALTALLEGKTGAYRDIVLLNTAAALVIADKADNLKAGAAMAAGAIDSGKARAVLDKVAAITRETVR